MKKSFFTGLGILLPIVLTIVVVGFLLNVLTGPFVGFVQEGLGLLNWPEQVVLFISKILVLFILVGITFLMGLLARWVITHYVIKYGDRLFHQIPIVNKIYRAIQEVVSTLFNSESPKFSKVVLVRFPHTKGWALGFLVNDKISPGSDESFSDLVSVFVPAAPNPTMGFNLLYHSNELIPLDMKVEDALKCIVSCGVMFRQNGNSLKVS
jgi:uncharacterized membrane protein